MGNRGTNSTLLTLAVLHNQDPYRTASAAQETLRATFREDYFSLV